MPLTYVPAGSPGTRLGELKLARETLEKINLNLEKQTELLERIEQQLQKSKK